MVRPISCTSTGSRRTSRSSSSDRSNAAFADRLASFTRLILFDKRGTGLSDRKQTPDLDMRADDLRAVLDAIGSTQAVLLGHSEGGALGAFFAATHPDRVSALNLYGSAARYAWAPDYPLGMPREEYLARTGGDHADVGNDRARQEMDGGRSTFVRPERGGHPLVGEGGAVLRIPHGRRRVRGHLVRDRRPRRPRCGPSADARALPARGGHGGALSVPRRSVPGRPVPRSSPGRTTLIVAGDIDEAFGAIDGFLTSISAEAAEIDRVLATVLFTDIVEIDRDE